MDLLISGVLMLLAIAGATMLAPKFGVAPHLLLAVVGLGVGALPFFPDLVIDPEWILAGILPPLLYSSGVSLPAMDFRRDFGAISGLSVLLVVFTSALLGLLFAALIPGLGIAMGIALGAILSPTDAVATSIVKRLGVSPRITALLEGESLLNDASALVVLRSAIAASAASISFWSIAADFLFAVAIAVVIGGVVGFVGLRVRALASSAAVTTVLSFTTPFIASLPVERLGGSGLVAAVVAGLITGQGAARYLPPQHRLSDAANWRTIELVLEGFVFLFMGLELRTVLTDLEHSGDGIAVALGLAAIGLCGTIILRSVYVAPLLLLLSRRRKRAGDIRDAIVSNDERFQKRVPERLRASERFQSRLRRQVSDLTYYVDEGLGWREGVVVVWAGMRGAITLAAAQTLPATTPHRSLLVFIAFLVATGSLLVQGATLPRVAKWLLPPRDEVSDIKERRALKQQLQDAALEELRGSNLSPQFQRVAERMRAAWLESADEGESASEAQISTIDSVKRFEEVRNIRLRMIRAQRTALLEARDAGAYSAATLNAALQELDAEQMSVELKAL